MQSAKPMTTDQTLTGNIRTHPSFHSQILGNMRDVLVYLPPGYQRSRRRFPVMYLHDGQNVFDASTAFGGVEWGADETAQELITTGQIAPLILVAVANAGADRVHEYAPTRGLLDPEGRTRRRSRGLARKYGAFLVNELKPFIDRTYRTQPEAECTGLGGSSLGGLVTLALGLRHPEVFTRLAVMSPSIWWDNCAIYGMVDAVKRKPPSRIWLDTGTAEEGWQRARELRDRLLNRGWKLGTDLHYLEAPGAEHSEAAWAARFGSVLEYLYPPAISVVADKLSRTRVAAALP